MNSPIADIALMMVLPLGVTFTAILLAVSSETRTQKILGVFLSILIVAMDCVFYFAKNSFVTYNCDGGLLLAFASLVLFAFICAIRSFDRATKVANLFFAFFMAAGFMGIAYWDRPTFIPLQDYSPSEIAAINSEYEDYISSFANGERKNYKVLKATKKVEKKELKVSGNLDSYKENAETLIKRMELVNKSIDEFEPLPANVSESEREIRSSQALAINNNAVSLNRKVLGLFHPYESSEAHSELIQASECIRLASYALYQYTLQENPEQQLIFYKQSREQLADMKTSLNRFWKSIENLQSNNQQNQIEQ